MKYRHGILLFVAVSLLAGPLAAESLEDVLAKVYDARGGLKNIKSVESARITGIYDMGMMKAEFTMEWKRPDKLRIDFKTPQGDGAQAFSPS